MATTHRILSLLPSSTEIVCLLGLTEQLIGRSHDADFPKSVQHIPVVTTTTIDSSLPSRMIDTFVREASHQGRSLYHLDTALVKKLQPTLVLTQELCQVCAISFTEVKRASRYFASDVSLLSLEPESVTDMLENIRTIAALTGVEERAQTITLAMQKRLRKVSAYLPAGSIPTVVIIEWLDPLMTAGHWVPEMVKLAGGRLLLSAPGKSQRVTEDQILAADPDILIFAPCGFTISRTKQELPVLLKYTKLRELRAFQNHRVYLMDGDAYLTRSGPRLIDGVEILAHILFPDIFAPPPPRDAVLLEV